MQGVGLFADDFGQLSPEVGYVRGVVLLCDDTAAELHEPVLGGAADALGVVGILGNHAESAMTIYPEDIAGVDANEGVAQGSPEDVVAGLGDVGVGGEAGENDYAVLLGQWGCAEHCSAAGGAEDNLHAINFGEFLVGSDGVLGVALFVLDDNLEHAAIDAAGGVDLVNRHLLGLDGHHAVGLAGARDGFHDPNPEWLILSGLITTSTCQGHDSQDCQQSQQELQGFLLDSHIHPPYN